MKKILLLGCFCIYCQLSWAQLQTTVPQRSMQQLKKQLHQVPTNTNFVQQIQQITFGARNYSFGNSNQHNQQSQPQAYAYKDLAFFCKIEVQLEKVVKLPVKFRLGSVDYVDYLEGKRLGF